MFNFAKGLACIAVVFIHITFPGAFGVAVAKAATFSVPTFFMIAGFYSVGCTKEKITGRLRKIIIIFLYGYFCSLAVTIIKNIVYEKFDCGLLLQQIFSVKALIKFFVFCTVSFAVPLWYLIAMAETYALWWFVVKYNKEKLFLRLIPILFALMIITTAFCESLNLSWSLKINFLIRGLPWFLLGYYCKTNIDKIKGIGNLKLILLVVFGLIIAEIPVLIPMKVNFSMAGVVMFSVGLFFLCIKYISVSLFNPLEYIGDYLSLSIYLSHFLIGDILNLILEKALNFNIENEIYLWFRPLIVLVLTLAFAQALAVIKAKRKKL